jgi:hypothetical protein
MYFGLARSQRDFAAALFDPTLTVPPDVRAGATARAMSAFAVYRNNVASSLINVLRSRFPTIVRFIGDRSFEGLALRFIVLQPPRSPVLMGYGEDFPAFLESLNSTPCAGYLADIARLEVARGRAYHAADIAPIAASSFAALTPQQLPGLRVALHPSVSLLRSRFPCVSAWQANQPGSDGLIRCWKAEDAVVARPHYDVTVALLPDGGFAFLSSLAAGVSLANAVDAASCDCAAFDLAANLAVLTGAGIVIDIL